MNFYWHLIYLSGLILCTTAYVTEWLKNRRLSVALANMAYELVTFALQVQNDPRFAQPLPKKEENATQATH